MLLRWTTQASEHFNAIYTFIAADSPAAALAQVRIISASIAGLPASPLLGRPGRVPSTRELIIPATSYLVAYRVLPNDIQILGIYHGAQRWPRSSPP